MVSVVIIFFGVTDRTIHCHVAFSAVNNLLNNDSYKIFSVANNKMKKIIIKYNTVINLRYHFAKCHQHKLYATILYLLLLQLIYHIKHLRVTHRLTFYTEGKHSCLIKITIMNQFNPTNIFFYFISHKSQQQGTWMTASIH